MEQFMSIMTVTADSAATGVDMGIQTIGTIAIPVLMFVLMYFILIRPQKKQEKAAQKMRDELQIGDEVVTIGGIIGIVVRKGSDTVIIETGNDKSRIRIKSSAIAENLTVHDVVEEEASAKEIKKKDKNKEE